MLTVEEIHVFACINDEGLTIRSFETQAEAVAFAEGFNSAAAQVANLQAENPEIDSPQFLGALEIDSPQDVICALDDVTEDAEPLEPAF